MTHPHQQIISVIITILSIYLIVIIVLSIIWIKNKDRRREPFIQDVFYKNGVMFAVSAIVVFIVVITLIGLTSVLVNDLIF